MKAKEKIKTENITKKNTLSVYDMQGGKIEEVTAFFNGAIDKPVIAQVVQMYLANKRTGLAATKTRGEVSGGGKKPWKQKGTGRARAGSIRSPLWRHGGVVFGPHPRDFHYLLPAKIRNRALFAALNEKHSNDCIMVVGALKLSQPKSKEIKKMLDALKVSGKAMLVMNTQENDIQRAARNLPYLSLSLAKDLNALDVLSAKKVIFTKDALKTIEQRLLKI